MEYIRTFETYSDAQREWRDHFTQSLTLDLSSSPQEYWVCPSSYYLRTDRP
jgi:hypothetical protein